MNDSLTDLVRNKPYTFRQINEWWMLNWFRRIEYGIYFEDTLIRTTTLDYENLKEYVSLMNCAWQMGAGSGWVAGSLDFDLENAKVGAENFRLHTENQSLREVNEYLKGKSEAPVYILENYDRWDEMFPWDIVGYTTSEEEANAWVEEAKKYKTVSIAQQKWSERNEHLDHPNSRNKRSHQKSARPTRCADDHHGRSRRTSY